MKANLLLIILFCVSTLVLGQTLEKNSAIKFAKVAGGMQFPEGPAWDGNGNLYVSNCHSNWVARITGDKADTFAVSPTGPYNIKQTNGLIVSKDGYIYGCESGKGAIVRFSRDGKCELVCGEFNGKNFSRPNDLAFDPKGNLYFTDPKSYDKNNLDGTVYMIPKGSKEAKPVYTGLGFPNGIAFSKDGKFVFVCESAQQRILKFPVKKDGTLDKFTVFAELPGGDPDGIAFDSENHLYVAHFGGGAVYVFNQDGSLKQKIETPGKKPSNLEFAGKDMRTLYLTEDETDAVYKTQVDIPGRKLFNSPGM